MIAMVNYDWDIDDPPAPVRPDNELEKLWDAIVQNTKGDLFWIGEILLSELEKETGYRKGRGS